MGKAYRATDHLDVSSENRIGAKFVAHICQIRRGISETTPHQDFVLSFINTIESSHHHGCNSSENYFTSAYGGFDPMSRSVLGLILAHGRYRILLVVRKLRRAFTLSAGSKSITNTAYYSKFTTLLSASYFIQDHVSGSPSSTDS